MINWKDGDYTMGLNTISKKTFCSTPYILFGREAEINEFVDHFDTVLEGAFGVCVLQGEAGVGKTHFAFYAAQKLQSKNCTYLYGEFNHYSQSAFGAINEIFREIVEHALTLSDTELTHLKIHLNKSLGQDFGFIKAICPETSILIENCGDIVEDNYYKLEYRVFHTVLRFLDIISQKFYPLIIHLDDLQWADEGSLRMIQYLRANCSGLNFSLILSLREAFECDQNKLSLLDSITNADENDLVIPLRRFSAYETRDFLCCLMIEEIQQIESVSSYFYNATLGSPFYILQLLDTLQKNGKYFFNKTLHQYQFDLEYLDNFHLPDDIKTGLIHQIELISDIDRRILKVLACLGGQADLDMIIKLLEYNVETISLHLDRLCHLGLLSGISDKLDAGNIRYSFVHDIIFEAMYHAMSESERSSIHFEVGKKLFESEAYGEIEEHSIIIGTSLLSGQEHVLIQSDSDKYILVLYSAAKKLKQRTSIEESLELLIFCTKIMGVSTIKPSTGLSFEIKLELAECLGLCGFVESAESEFNELTQMSLSKEQRITIHNKLILHHAYQGDHTKVISTGLEILNDLDFHINISNLHISLFKEMLVCKKLFTSDRIDQLKDMKKVNDPRLKTIETTLIRMAGSANLTDESLFALIILKLSRMSMKHGILEHSSPTYASCSFMLYHFLSSETKALQLAENAESLLSSSEQGKCMTFFILGAFIEHWRSESVNSLNYLTQAIEAGMIEGEFQYAAYAFTSMVEMKYVMGVPIQELLKASCLLDEYDQRLKHEITQSTLFVLENHLDQLVSGSSKDFEANEFYNLDKSQKLTYYYYMLQRLYIERKMKQCYELLSIIEPMLNMFKGFILEVDLLFYITMIRLENHKNLNTINKIVNRIKIYRALKKFETWITSNESNHMSMYLYIKGKTIQVFSRSDDIGALYEEGIKLALENKQLHLVAIGYLLAADHYTKNNRIALDYGNEAAKALEHWGAFHYADLIRIHFKIETTKDLYTDQMADRVTEMASNHLDSKELPISESKSLYNLTHHIQQVEHMNLDETFLYLLNSLIVEHKAHCGSIYLEINDQVCLLYEKSERTLLKHTDPVSFETEDHIPRKVLRYVLRTGSEIVLNQKQSSGKFSNDTYIDEKNKLSLLCVPLKYADVFVGILYMEWNETFKVTETIQESIRHSIPLLTAKLLSEEQKKLKIKIHSTDKKKEQYSDIPLTKRELEVFKLIVRGLTNKQVGESLCISLSTVKTHIINIYSKLEIKNRVAAVEKAKFYGLID